MFCSNCGNTIEKATGINKALLAVSIITTQNNSTNPKRIEWLDIAKGISMLCIVAGHMNSATVQKIVFTFHVPLFFLISGYLISQKQDYITFCKNKIRGLILPYIYISFLLIILKIPTDIYYDRSQFILEDLKNTILSACYGSGSSLNKTIHGIQPIGAIWFLLALFWALLIVKFFMNKKYGFLVIICIATISYISSWYIWLPWDIQSGGTAAIFVYVGAYINKKQLKLDVNWLLLFISILSLVLEFIFNIQVSVVRNYYKYTVVSIIGAILISYIVVIFSKMLTKTNLIKRILCFWGENSLIVLCFHLIELNNYRWHIFYSNLGDIPLALKHVICFAIKLIFISLSTYLTFKTKNYIKKFNGSNVS